MPSGVSGGSAGVRWGARGESGISSRCKDYMGIALDMARLGTGRTSPNPMVGAVIVKNGKILATGFHRKAGRAHAEIEALRAVGARSSRPGGRTPPLHGATLYVTLEPCCHQGRTPPCTDAILKSGIRRVVIGMRDPDPKVSGRGIKILKKAGIQVRVGMLEKECRELNEAYVKHRTAGRPFVILKMATTADAKVGVYGRDGERRPYKISGPESLQMVHALRDQVDAILVGIGTVLSDDPRLTTRLKGTIGKSPIRIVLDGRLRIPLRSKVLSRGVIHHAPTWIATTVGARHPKLSRLRRLRTLGVEILFCRKDREGRVDLVSLLAHLASRNILSLLVEGGPQIWSSFLTRGLVDRIILFRSHEVLGERGVPMYPDSVATHHACTADH